MLGIVYILLCFFVGYNVIKLVLPQLANITLLEDAYKRKVTFSSFMISLPASYLIGTLLVTWTTYFSAYLFKSTSNPLLYGNLISMVLFAIISGIIAYKLRADYKSSYNNVKTFGGYAIVDFIKKNWLELIFILSSTILVGYLMNYTFYMKNNALNIGPSVASDFGPHIAVIRSFSLGSNFPTIYPHFPSTDIKYHFLFQFLTGNLEFLGIRLDWAFNIPSTLSLVAFFMLLYSLTVFLFNSKLAGILASVLFFFRSSFAFVTYISELIKKGTINSVSTFFKALYKVDIFIGKTEHEDWGLWNQNVYLNQRHLAFSLAVMILIFILVFPHLKKMLSRLHSVLKTEGKDNTSSNMPSDDVKSKKTSSKPLQEPKAPVPFDNTKFVNWMNEFLLGKDAWVTQNLTRAISIGVLLGLIGFWNGAVFIATGLILFCLAIFSKHRLEFLIIAVIGLSFFFGEAFFFTNFSESTPKDSVLKIGFLAHFPTELGQKMGQYTATDNYIGLITILPQLMRYILEYYFELLGIMPLILIAGLLTLPKKLNKNTKLAITLSFCILIAAITYIAITSNFAPNISNTIKYILCITMIIEVLLLNFIEKLSKLFRGTRLLTLIFLSPIVMATFIGLTPDIAVNHKYIMISVALLNIVAAYFLSKLFKNKYTSILAVILIIALTFTGVIDLFAILKKNEHSVTLRNDDEIYLWVKNETSPKSVFFTHPYYLHSILYAGRSIYFGHAYYAWSAGYNTDERNQIFLRIFGAKDSKTLKELVQKTKVDYIVIDNEVRKSKDYRFNENLFKSNFELVKKVNDVDIYKVN